MEVKSCPFCHLKQRILKQNKTAQLFLSNPRKVEKYETELFRKLPVEEEERISKLIEN